MTAPSLRDLEALMDGAWPAPDRAESNGWVLRAASGVTQRANSVWPREPGS
ncbi:MAG: family acetyltransferase, partial [Pseudarthrobacter sp.]|nr:family acetyltransferase [Pseudarthrobacter sp.]